jgi:amino acid transporter
MKAGSSAPTAPARSSIPKGFPARISVGSLTLAGLYVIAVIRLSRRTRSAGATASNTIAATAIGVVLGRKAEIIVALTILISTFSANSVILTAPRVSRHGVNDNLFFKTR